MASDVSGVGVGDVAFGLLGTIEFGVDDVDDAGEAAGVFAATKYGDVAEYYETPIYGGLRGYWLTEEFFKMNV